MTGNEPAFPRTASEDRTFGDLPDGNSMVKAQEGISIRDYFAAKAMLGIVMGTQGTPESSDLDSYPHTVAYGAYLIADAMLKAREPKKEQLCLLSVTL